MRTCVVAEVLNFIDNWILIDFLDICREREEKNSPFPSLIRCLGKKARIFKHLRNKMFTRIFFLTRIFFFFPAIQYILPRDYELVMIMTNSIIPLNINDEWFCIFLKVTLTHSTNLSYFSWNLRRTWQRREIVIIVSIKRTDEAKKKT